MVADRTNCGKCHRKCSGQVLSVEDTFFHHYCFTCQNCGNELGEDAFYNKDGAFYCAKDYIDIFGEQCFKCHQFLEGEVITALENTFHLDCFTCCHCKKFFPPGETVIFNGQDYVCEDCDMGVDPSSRLPLHKCAGCHKDIETGQALMALDQHWHPRCFTCHKCGVVLHGEYMGKDGYAYCEKDYQAEFGVVCASCSGYITGKVLQAGDKHYHPQCSRCAKCGQMFGEGEEMYLQGSEIWHPQCSEMVREMERAEKERAEMEQREAERREMEERETQRREAERMEVERREAERREADRRDAERREADRRDAERREADRRDSERRENERRERERMEAEQRERERREMEERREAERREIEQREMERREMERREAERIEMEHREAERREMERKEWERKNQRGYYQGQVGAQINVNIDGPMINHTDPLPPPNFSPPGRNSPQFDDLPPPPRPDEMPKGPPAPPTRSASRATDWKARYGSLPRNASGSSDTNSVQMRNAPARPRPHSYHESSYNDYEETHNSITVSETTNSEQKYKTSVQLKIGKSADDISIGRSTRTTSSSSISSPSKEYKVIPYKDLRVDNYRAPRGVDKTNLEKYLDDDEFREVFKMSRDEFYELPKWKQHDHKKKVKLF